MSINWNGIGIGFMAAKEQQRRDAEDEQRVTDNAQKVKDNAFQDELRGRQRTEWKETDRIKAADKADIADVNAQYAGKATQPTTGASADDVATAQKAVAADKLTANIDSILDAPPADPLPGTTPAPSMAKLPDAPTWANPKQAAATADSSSTDTSATTAPAAVAVAAAAAPAAPAAQATPVATTAPVLAAPSGVAAAPAPVVTTTAVAPIDTSNSPKLDPAVAAKVQVLAQAKGLAAHDFNDSLAMQQELIRRKAARGDMTPEDYATKTTMLKRMQTEGINDAVNLMAQGRYDEAMQAYNSAGSMKGAKVVKAEQGTTKINGQDVPTNFVTIRNADGTNTVMDATKAQYQLLDLNTQLQHADRARTFDQSDKQHTDTLKLQREQLAQSAKDAAAGRSIQMAQLRQSAAQFNASTPFGQIASIELAMGGKMTPEQRAQKLGIDTMNPAARAQLNSYLKQQDAISGAMNKAQADGTWQPESQGAKDMNLRSAMLNQQVSDLLIKVNQGPKAGADPLGILPATQARGGTPSSAAAPGAAPQAARQPVLTPVGGIPIAERDKRIDTFNNTVGGGGALARRTSAQESRQADAAANFDTQLASMKRGMTRADAIRVLDWFNDQAEAGTLTNVQLQQVRQARHAAGY